MIYKNYTLVAEWKKQAQELGLNWRDVRRNYDELRRAAREYEQTIRTVRRLAFRLGIRKNHPAFSSGDLDHDAIRGFDVVAALVADCFPWIKDEHDDPAPKLFELIQRNEADFTLSDDEAWKAALDQTFEETTEAALRFDPSDFEVTLDEGY